jgi:hypothetical protein
MLKVNPALNIEKILLRQSLEGQPVSSDLLLQYLIYDDCTINWGKDLSYTTGHEYVVASAKAHQFCEIKR